MVVDNVILNDTGLAERLHVNPERRDLLAVIVSSVPVRTVAKLKFLILGIRAP